MQTVLGVEENVGGTASIYTPAQACHSCLGDGSDYDANPACMAFSQLQLPIAAAPVH